MPLNVKAYPSNCLVFDIDQKHAIDIERCVVLQELATSRGG